MNKFAGSLRRAVATFIFATMGCLVGFDLFNVDAATWKVAASTGVGAVGNLAYRWAEAVLHERRSVVDDELVGADAKDRGASALVLVLVVLCILFLVGIRVTVR